MKITFIQTGGTIDKDYPKTTKGWAFEISEPAVNRILEKLNPSFDYEVLSFCKKDSLEITEDDRQNLIHFCKNQIASKIIITHGTDTMIETGKALSSISNKTIILTGAMRPERFSNSDAAINIGVALGAIQCLNEGIYIAMDGLVIPINKVKRNLKSGQFIIEEK
jgi:L-asparaginase